MAGQPDVKRRRRRATRAEQRRIRQAKITGKPCRGCGARNVPMNGHHLLGGNRREDREDALIPLGGSGTVGCHGILTSHHAARDCRGRWRSWDVVASNIRATLSDEETAYIVGEVGDVGLQRLYPRRPITVRPTGGNDAA